MNSRAPPPQPPPIPPPIPPPLSFSPARDGVIQPTRPAPAAPRPLQLSQGLKGAGAHLETIAASSLTTPADATMRSTPSSCLPTTHARAIANPDFFMTPSTSRLAADSRGIQRVIAGGSGEPALHAPRPLSERAMIPLGLRARRARLRQGGHDVQLSPLRLSPLSASSSSPWPSSPMRQDGRLQVPLSPLGFSPLRASPMAAVASPSRPALTNIVAHKNNMEPLPKTPTSWPQSDAYAEANETQRTPRQQMNLNSMRAHDGDETDSGDDLVIGPGAPSPRMILEFQSRLDGEEPVGGGGASWGGSPLRRPPLPPRARCYMCPEPCRPGTGLCGACQRRFQPPADSDLDPSGSEYEDAPSLSLSLSPQKPNSFSTTPSTPTRVAHQQYHRSSNTATSSSPETPATPRGWSRISTPVLQHQQQHQQVQQQYNSSGKSSLRASPMPRPTKQLKVFPPPPPRQDSIASSTTSGRNKDENNEGEDDKESGPFISDRRGSALYHLERSMNLKNWQPLAPGAEPQSRGHDVIRVGSVPSPRVVVRNSDAENADTMKMLADEGLEEVNARRPGHERRHEAGGSYGDWFSFYAAREGDNETSGYVDDNKPDPYASPSSDSLKRPSPVSISLSRGLLRSLSRRESTGSSVYDRILSIYDTYAEMSADEDEKGEEVEAF